MGSSFAAGAGIGPTKPNTPSRCGRTANNYATLLAGKLGLDLTDVTCGGATTAHLTGPWGDLPAQIDAVTPNTRLVTVTIGGNDIGYVGGLIRASCRTGVPMGGRPCPAGKIPTEADYAKLDNDLRAFARQVFAKAPQARLIFVQYVTLDSPTSCEVAPLQPEDAANSRAIGLHLAEITVRAAHATGALVLPADELSRDHTPCSAEPWSRGMSSVPASGPGSPWHPTVAGHAGIATALGDWFAHPVP
jgi:hypothetical protein